MTDEKCPDCGLMVGGGFNPHHHHGNIECLERQLAAAQAANDRLGTRLAELEDDHRELRGELADVRRENIRLQGVVGNPAATEAQRGKETHDG